MLTQEQAHEFAEHWIHAWNSHDLEAILSHYDEDIVLVSPIAAKLISESLGTIKGKLALLSYFQKGLEVYPSLNFKLINFMWGISSIVLYYSNESGTKSGEFMELNSIGKVIRVIAHYNR